MKYVSVLLVSVRSTYEIRFGSSEVGSIKINNALFSLLIRYFIVKLEGEIDRFVK